MIKVCLNCNKEFETSHSKRKCCSRKCSNELLHPRIILKCEICNKEISGTKSEIERNKRHYCSNECRAIGVGLYQSGKNNPNYKNANTMVKCSNCKCDINILQCNLKNSDGSLKKNFYCSKECKAEYQKESLKGKNNPKYRGGDIIYKCDNCGEEIFVRRYKFANGQKYFYCSQECKATHQQSILLGENNSNYIHGLSEDYRERYRIIEGYNTWRREVYQRDNFTCQVCGNDRGGNLNAHHLNSYDWDIENRTNPSNGITLCEDCHKGFHSIYGNGNNTRKQFKQFIENKLC